MFLHGRGEMHDWLKRNQRDMSDCGERSPIQHLERQGVLSGDLLAVHVNYLSEHDAQLLSDRRVSVAHCPRSHAYFRHQRFPFDELTRAGVNICLGTDSLVSVRKVRGQRLELNLFSEMAAFQAAMPDLAPAAVLEMATLNGALALGLEGYVGALAPAAFADVIALPYSGKIDTVHEAVVHHEGSIHATMIDGEWAIKPGDGV